MDTLGSTLRHVRKLRNLSLRGLSELVRYDWSYSAKSNEEYAGRPPNLPPRATGRWMLMGGWFWSTSGLPAR